MVRCRWNGLAEVIAASGTSAFWPRLDALVCENVPHEMMGVFIYDGNEPPVRIYDSEGSAERDVVHSVLASAGYLISPYYNKLIVPRAAEAFYRLSDVAADDFLNSEYFHVYYAKKQVADEGMYHLPLSQTRTLVVMVERSATFAAFTTAEYECLKMLTATLAALVRNHLRFLSPEQYLTTGKREDRVTGFRDIAEHFGHEILSNREREVAMLILRGHSTKSAARELNIAPETERVHRRRLYARLGLSSHSELFWLFFKAADFFDASRHNDPLADYLKSRRSSADARVNAS